MTDEKGVARALERPVKIDRREWHLEYSASNAWARSRNFLISRGGPSSVPRDDRKGRPVHHDACPESIPGRALPGRRPSSNF